MKLAELRKTIEAIERRSPRRKVSGPGPAEWSFGMAVVDEALPGGGVCTRSLHDVIGMSPGDAPAAAGFALALMARLPRQGDVLWCQSAVNRREYGGLYGPGVGRFGFDPARIVQVAVRSAKDLAWVMEEGVRSGSLAAVVGEGPLLGFTATRRLSLAAAEMATPCLLVADPGMTGASSAATRWRVSTLPGEAERPAFQIELLRCRGGQPGSWRMMWDHETYSFHPFAPLRDGDLSSQPAGRTVVLDRRTG